LQAHLEVTPERVQAVLPENVALVDLLEYTDSSPPPAGKGQWKWERRLAGFVVRRGRSIERLDLGPIEPIEEAIAAWRVALGADHAPAPPTSPPAALPRDRQELGKRVRRLVWEPLESHLQGVPTVLVSPDGASGQLPWAALPGQKPETYLIEERAIAVVPVPQDLPELLAEPAVDKEPGPKPQGLSPSLLLVGDVDYGSAPGLAQPQVASRAAALERAGSWAGFKPLPATRGEILAVRDTFEQRLPDAPPPQVLRDGHATEEAFRQEAPRRRFLHLATHGFFAPPGLRSALDPEKLTPGGVPGIDRFGGQGIVGFHPGLLSGLALAGANRVPEPGQDDGILTALEVAELDLSGVEMVVLSACETGLGQASRGEGVLGLQRAFQVAGARGVMASLWSVNDEATRSLMEGFYEKLWGQPAMGKLEALRQAQLWMLTNWKPRGGLERPAPEGPPPPYVWAAFVLSGDWR